MVAYTDQMCAKCEVFRLPFVVAILRHTVVDEYSFWSMKENNPYVPVSYVLSGEREPL